MQFSFENALGTVQRTVYIVLRSFRWMFAIIYLDDVIIFSKTIVNHILHLKAVLSILIQEGIMLKLHKSFFFYDQFEYLGHGVFPVCLNVGLQTCNSA